MHDHHSDNPAHDHDHGCGNHCAGHDHEGGCACHAQEPAHESQPHRCHHADIIATLTKERDEYLAGWQRAKADYQNFKRETEQMKKEWADFANLQTLQSFFPLVDFFKYAFLSGVPKDMLNTEWMKGIKHIQDQLNAILRQAGVEEISTVGEKFDPERHESISEAESDQAPGTIVEETATGFHLRGKVLRPAKVKVAKEPPTSS